MDQFTRRSLLQAAGASASGQAPAARRPNVLWMMADQLRWDCVGANGNRLIRTPNLDRLAARSANFTNAFVQAPVCVPSRVSYFTGRYPHSHKNRVNYTPCDPREVFLHRMLKDAGYQTGSVGKLHFHPPSVEHARATGFDRLWLDDGVSATDPYSDYVKWRNANDPQARSPYNATAKNLPPGRNPYRALIDYEYTQTHWVGLKTLELLREFTRSEKPFFLFSSFFKPHAPFTVPAPFDSMYDDIEIPLPRQVTLDYIRRLPLPLQKLILRGTPVYDTPRERLQWIYRSYYGAVSMVDREAGRILEELENSGAASNTIVILSTDHGDQLLEHGLHGKNLFFESSVRVPFLMSFPGRVRSGRFAELVEMVDVLPTILEFCGVPVPDNVQGRSFAPLTNGGTYRPRECVYAENIIPEVITGGQLRYEFVPGQGIAGIRHPDAKMVRTSRWKLNFYPGHDGELYDLSGDPGEWENLYTHAARRGTVAELKELLLEWMIYADENDQIARRWML